MVAMNRKERDGLLRHALLLALVTPTAIVVETCIAEDDHDVIPGGLHLFAEMDNAVKVTVGITSQINHRFLLSIPRTLRDTANPATASSS